MREKCRGTQGRVQGCQRRRCPDVHLLLRRELNDKPSFVLEAKEKEEAGGLSWEVVVRGGWSASSSDKRDDNQMAADHVG